jgi:hypothetical protein
MTQRTPAAGRREKIPKLAVKRRRTGQLKIIAIGKNNSRGTL